MKKKGNARRPKILRVEIPSAIVNAFKWVVCPILAAIAAKLIDTPYQAAANTYREKKLFAYAESLTAVPCHADRLYYGCTIVNKSGNALVNFDVRVTLEVPIGDQSYQLLPDTVYYSPGATIGERFLNTKEPLVVGRLGVTLISRGEWVQYGYYVVGSDLARVKTRCEVDPKHVAGLEPADANPPPPGFDIYRKVPSWSAWLVVSVVLLIMILAIFYFVAWIFRVWPSTRWKQ